MAYKIAICDDIQKDRDYICSLVKGWAETTQVFVELQTFPSAEAFLFKYEEEKDFDILLLDIEMKEMNGVELAKKVRAENKEIQIIFITGYTEYISDGYDVEALHYILKPVHSEKLYETLSRACEKIKKNEQALMIEASGETVRLPLYTISYIEVRSNYVTIHASEVVSVKTTLSTIEKNLDDSFFRIGRSCIVNLRFIRKITRNEVFLSNEEVLPLPRGYYEPLNRTFINHF